MRFMQRTRRFNEDNLHLTFPVNPVTVRIYFDISFARLKVE